MDPESIEVIPSEDGNVTPETPKEEPTPVTPTEPTEPVTPTEPELFELPDGRKVDAETLSKEWKENFYPDYTRKSQALAAKEQLPKTDPTNPLADPNYVPETYAELAEQIKQQTLKEIEQRNQAEIDARTAIENEVVNQLSEVKKIDTNVNENALFLHATKYGFRDLKVAYQNMKDMNELAKNVQQTTVKNITKRNDPVSVAPGAGGVRPDPSQFSTAVEYMRSLK